MSVYSKEVVITNPLGIHARPSTLIVKKATELGNHGVFLEKKNWPGMKADPMSIMPIMMLAASVGETIIVSTKENSDQARHAVDALAELIDSGFGEAYT